MKGLPWTWGLLAGVAMGCARDAANVDGTSERADASDAISRDATNGSDAQIDATLDASLDANVDAPNGGTCPTGEAMCPTTPFNNESRSSYRCQTVIDGACPAPDLIVVRHLLIDDGDGNTVGIVTQDFPADAPELTEGCIPATGMRRLLTFNFGALNQGNQNMDVGRPNEMDPVHWEWFEAHHHWHIKGWGDYRLRTLDGREIGYGHKQSFCLEDNIRVSDTAGPRQFPPPLCENFDPNLPYDQRPEFGLSQGWGDEYPSNVRCQWVDLGSTAPSDPTYVPDGYYDLDVSVNMNRDGTHLYRESNYTNNTARVRLWIQGSFVASCNEHASEPCAGGSVQCDGSCR